MSRIMSFIISRTFCMHTILVPIHGIGIDVVDVNTLSVVITSNNGHAHTRETDRECNILT